MKHRKLRIAWSVAWGIVAVLLVAFWVRSFWIVDLVGRGIFLQSETVTLSAISEQGTLCFHRGRHALDEKLRGLTDQWEHHTSTPKSGTIVRFLWRHTDKDFWVGFPMWIPGILIVGAGWIPWLGLKRQFALRTLLIAATLVAIALGLITWAIK